MVDVGHVIAEFSRIDRFSKLWATSMDRKMSPRYSQVMMVSVYSSLTAVNYPSLEWRIFELTDYECE